MNKKELVVKVSKSTQMTQKEVTLVLTEIIDTIIDTVSKGKSVRLVGFGCFSLKRNNNRLSKINQCVKKVSPRVVKFSAGKFFKENIDISN
jgi:nucleoid DNA-binding protein